MTKEEALQVVTLAMGLLTPESRWTKEGAFDQECQISSEKYNLGCALKLMQLSVMGSYASRNLIMRKVRNAIRWNFFWRQGFHPIHSFNQHPKTTYQDVMKVLQTVKEDLE